MVCLFPAISSFIGAQGRTKQDVSTFRGPYFGQEAPRDIPGLFLDGVISTEDEAEMNAGFSKDGREFDYCARYQDHWAIFATREEDGRWVEPEPMSFTSDFTDRDFTVSPDG